MGPGCFHPRNEVRTVSVKDQIKLQWGRDVSIPEIAAATRWASSPPMLQWGRDVSIPEMLMAETVSHKLAKASMGPGCFHPRNGSKAVPGEPPVVLQWGRDVS